MRGALIGLALAFSWSVRADEINLFPRAALERAAIASRSDRSDRAISSAWRAVERSLGVQFAPTAAAITDETVPTLLARQAVRRREPAKVSVTRGSQAHGPPPGGPADAAADQARSRDAQIDAAQEAYEEPAEWRVVEVEVAVDADGVAGPGRVVVSSRRATVDAEAVDAVQRAVGHAEGLGGPVVARFRVEAGVSVIMSARATVQPTTAKPNGFSVTLVRGRFGGGKAEANTVFTRRVRTRVALLSLEGPIETVPQR